MAPTALVTGSSSGIGRAIALRLAADGFRALRAGIRREPLTGVEPLTGGEPADALIARGGGTGVAGAPGHAAYAISKAGLAQLTRQVAVGYGRDGIICNSVAPGKIVTGTPGDLSQDGTTAAHVRSPTSFGRFGESRDVAAAVAFLAPDDATYVSGGTLMAAGGWMAC